jgi:hypothetical protein
MRKRDKFRPNKENPMDDSKFWLCLWCAVLITIMVCVCVPVIYHKNADVEMAAAGYVQKVVLIREGNSYLSPMWEKVWVKEGDKPTLIIPEAKIVVESK